MAASNRPRRIGMRSRGCRHENAAPPVAAPIASLDPARLPRPEETSAVHSLFTLPRLWQAGALRMRLCGMLPGLGIPPSERYILPLCGPEAVWKDCCHSRKHHRGAARFWSELRVDPLDLAAQLWRVSGDARAGQSTVMRARQAAMAVRQHRELQDAKESSWRSALDRRAALRHGFRSTAMGPRLMSSELARLLASRS